MYVLKINTTIFDDFPNLCPYFWLTIFCTLVVPFVWFWRSPVKFVWDLFVRCMSALVALMELAATAIAGPINEYVCQPLDKYFVAPRIKALEPEKVVELWESGKKKDTALFNKWRDTVGYKNDADLWGDLDKWRKEVRDRRHALEQEEENAKHERQRQKWMAEQEAKAARKARQERLMKIAAATQAAAPYIVAVVATPIVIGALWLLWLLLGVLWSAPWAAIGHGTFIVLEWAFGITAVVAVVAVIGIFLWVVLKRVFGKCWMLFGVPFSHPVVKSAASSIATSIATVLRPIRLGLGRVGTGFADGLSLFKQYIKATKDGYCPQIEWKDTK
jgi:hypothetical protein